MKDAGWRTRELEGWGRHRRTSALAATPPTRQELLRALEQAGSEPLLAHGRGRSYGDSALPRGRALLTGGVDRALAFDRERGLLTVEAGITLEEVLEVTLPNGWFLPVTPGTRYPSVGGCLAADVHGKNHHVAGTFSRHVPRFTLLTASGEEIVCQPQGEHADLFRATAGGMGLTGIITEVTLQLLPVETDRIRSRAIRTETLAETMAELEANDRDWPYAVAWVDGTSPPEAAGRGEVLLGRHARRQELTPAHHRRAFTAAPEARLNVPVAPPLGLVNPLTTRLFNAAWRWKGGPSRRREGLEPVWDYFYPLDGVRRWNRLYGPKGFVQYQFGVPAEAGEEVLRQALEGSRRAGHPGSLIVLKRMGEEAGMLSFPMPGWMLAMDIPVRAGLFEHLDRLDAVVAEAGGRFYLAKDGRMSAETFRRTTPGYEAWLEVKRRVDPEGRFRSLQSWRLGIDEELKA